MGGYGSGPSGSGSKTLVEDCRVLDVNWLTRHGAFDSISAAWSCEVSWDELLSFDGLESVTCSRGPDSPFLEIAHRYYESDQVVTYAISLERTRLPWDGFRWWFTCPTPRSRYACNHRVSKLYLPNGRSMFGCRKCHDLTYTSCRKSGRLSVLAMMASASGLDGEAMGDLVTSSDRWEAVQRRRHRRNEQRRIRRWSQGWK